MSEQEVTLEDFAEGQTETKEGETAPPTELTEISDDWVAVPLNDIASNEEGAFVDGPFGSNLKADEMTDEGYARVVQLQNIRVSEFIDTNHKYISKEKFEELKRHGAKPGDVAIAKMSEPVARACLLPEIEEQYIVVADCIKLTVDKSGHNSIFVMLALNSRPVWKQAYARSRGSTRKRINLTQLKEVQIPTPSLKEQRKIASILYNVDQAIQKTEEIIDQTKQVRQGFIRERVTAQNADTERKEGTVGTRRVTIPDYWSVVRLGEVAEIVSGKSFPRDYQEGHAGPRAVIKVEDMNLPGNDKYINDVTNRVTDEVLDELNKNIFPGDTVIHPRVGEALLLNKTRITTEDAAFDDNIMGWVPEGIDPEYLYYASTMVDFNAVAQTGTVPSINKEMAANFRFPLPPEDEQEEIVEDLSRIDGQISIYEQEISQLRRLKQGLMQDLLSGTVRTADTNIEVLDEVAQHG